MIPGWRRGRAAGARAAAESRVPGTWRVSPRPGRGPGSAGRCGQREALPQGGLGARAGGKLVPELWALLLSTWVTSPQDRPREGRISGTGSSRRTMVWGREAGPEVEGEAWRPGLGPPQPPPLAASAASSGAGGRGRKLSDLVGETPKQTAVRNRCPLASALNPLASPRQPRPLATTSGNLF